MKSLFVLSAALLLTQNVFASDFICHGEGRLLSPPKKISFSDDTKKNTQYMGESSSREEISITHIPQTKDTPETLSISIFIPTAGGGVFISADGAAKDPVKLVISSAGVKSAKIICTPTSK